MKKIHKRPKQFGIEQWTYFSNKYRHDILANSQKIVDKRIYLSNYTDVSTSYMEFIRYFAFSFNIVVLRNDHNIKEGIVVVGEEFIVAAFERMFVAAIECIEQNIEVYNNLYYERKGIDLWTYRMDTIKKFTDQLYYGEKKEALLKDAWPQDWEKILTHETYNYIRYKEYRKQTPSLVVLKEFYHTSWPSNF